MPDTLYLSGLATATLVWDDVAFWAGNDGTFNWRFSCQGGGFVLEKETMPEDWVEIPINPSDTCSCDPIDCTYLSNNYQVTE